MTLRALLRQGLPLFSAQENDGVAAIEFAIYGTVFLMIVAATVDIGLALFTQSELDAAVSAGAQYAASGSANVNSTNGASLATLIANIVTGANGTDWADSTVVVNNGPTVTVTGGSSSSSGTAANADHQYCPTGSPGAWTWGSEDPASCALGVPGKFVTITASHNFSPIFSNFGFVPSGTISRSALIETQ
jgi:Flp pilus assembly protein TadG